MIGGRSGWLAWPVGVVCAGVVAALLVIAAPAVPSVVRFVGDTFHGVPDVVSAPPATMKPLSAIGTAQTDECRSLYPGPLWLRLTWNPDLVLSQDTAPPRTAAVSVLDALHPVVRMTCAWRSSAGAIVSTTLADVTVAPGIAQAALTSEGFSCRSAGTGVRCTRARGDVVEDHVVRDGVWLETTETGWQPTGYADELVDRLWPSS